MCSTCGCSDHTHATITDLEDSIPHAHDREHHHRHDHVHDHEQHQSGEGAEPIPRTIELEQDVLAKNNLIAQRNRTWLDSRGIVACNLMSSPGAGKTTLLEHTIGDLAREIPISVIEGDQETTRDAERIRAAGCRVIQINTGAGCHLDAEMLSKAFERLDPPARSLLMIENVGNLVCPALFDLGESARAVIVSVTEGDDKPLKYPHMFRAADLMILNKTDLLPYVPFSVERCLENARRVNPKLSVIQVSAFRGDGLDRWYAWIREEMKSAVPARA